MACRRGRGRAGRCLQPGHAVCRSERGVPWPTGTAGANITVSVQPATLEARTTLYHDHSYDQALGPYNTTTIQQQRVAHRSSTDQAWCSEQHGSRTTVSDYCTRSVHRPGVHTLLYPHTVVP